MKLYKSVILILFSAMIWPLFAASAEGNLRSCGVTGETVETFWFNWTEFCGLEIIFDLFQGII